MNAVSVLRSVTWDPAILAASLVANMLSLAVPLAMLQIYDRVIPNAAYETLTVLALMVLFALTMDCLLRISRSRLLTFIAARFERAAYSGAFRALILENPAHRQRVDGGTLVTRLSSIDRLRSQRADGAAAAILDLPFAAIFLGVIAILSPIVALTVAGTLTITVLLLSVLRRRIDDARKNRFETEARRYSFFSEVLSGIKAVRALQIGDLMNRRQERLLGRSAVHTRDMTRRIHQAQGLTAAIGNLIPVITAATAGFLVVSGEASLGVLAAVVVLSGRIVQPVLRVEGYLAGLENSRQAEADLRSLTDIPLRAAGRFPLAKVETLALQDVTTEPDGEHGVTFKRLNVSLALGDCLLLQDPDPVRLDAAARLFLGEMEFSKGALLVNDRPVTAYHLRDRQDRIRLLSEKAQLLTGTLFENICAFSPEKHREAALELAQELGLQKIMRQSPRGLQTRVRADMDGLPQSAQRIASNICGLVTYPDVIIFHMANTSLDMDTDKRLLSWLKQHAPHHILILMTNRPAYMALATQTLDLRTGALTRVPKG